MRPTDRLRSATKYIAKLQLLTSMNTTHTHSSSGEAKYPKLASWLLKPPRLTVVNMCIHASSQLMPPRR